MSAVWTLALAGAEGVVLAASGNELRARFPVGRKSAELLFLLKAHKAELLGILTGDRCRFCGEEMAWPAAAGVVFGDRTAAHHACYAADTLRRAKQALTPVDDEAELTIRSELP